jgi:hypothetical protein
MRSQRVRPVDVTPVKAYCQRLSSALAAVVHNSDDDFGINATDRFEVGLACAFDDNIEGALEILQVLSLPMACATAELASAGEWFTSAKGLLDQFDQSDLMVLSYNEQQKPKGLTKDDLLVSYSQLLTAVDVPFTFDHELPGKEGWEIAVQILGRLDDVITANERIEQILNDLPLDSSARVDKITQLCHNLGLSQHAVTIAQVSRITTSYWIQTDCYRNMPTIFARIPRVMAIHFFTTHAPTTHKRFKKCYVSWSPIA